VSAALRAGVVTLLALSLAGCGGGGGGGEEGAIKNLMNTFFDAFEKEDATQLAGLFSEDCGDISSLAEGAIEQYKAVGENIEVHLDRVEISDLTDTTAAALPIGTISIGGQEATLADETDTPTALVKEQGTWKIAQCDLFL